MRAGFRQEVMWSHVQRSENPIILLWSLGVSIELQRAQAGGSMRVSLHQQLEWIEHHRGNTSGRFCESLKTHPKGKWHIPWAGALEIKGEKVSRAPVFISLLPDYGCSGPTPHSAMPSLP